MTAGEKYIQTKLYLSKKGQIVEDFDIMIASIAISNNLTLVTHNTKHFQAIPDLQLTDWVAD